MKERYPNQTNLYTQNFNYITQNSDGSYNPPQNQYSTAANSAYLKGQEFGEKLENLEATSTFSIPVYKNICIDVKNLKQEKWQEI